MVKGVANRTVLEYLCAFFPLVTLMSTPRRDCANQRTCLRKLLHKTPPPGNAIVTLIRYSRIQVLYLYLVRYHSPGYKIWSPCTFHVEDIYTLVIQATVCRYLPPLGMSGSPRALYGQKSWRGSERSRYPPSTLLTLTCNNNFPWFIRSWPCMHRLVGRADMGPFDPYPGTYSTYSSHTSAMHIALTHKPCSRTS